MTMPRSSPPPRPSLPSSGWLVSLALLAACSQAAPPAPATSLDLAANSAMEASHESDRDDGGVTLRKRSEHGLDISPVPLDTSAMSPRLRLLAGLGSYIVNAASDCSACHSSPAGFLSGGNPFFLDAAGHVVWTRNLTPDPTTGLQLTWDQFREAMRTGKDFHPGATRMLVVMPWTTLRWASDLDLLGIYAYLRAIPAVVNPVPPDAKDALPLPASIPFPGRRYTDGDVVRRLEGAQQSFDADRGLEISPLAGFAKGKHPEREKLGVGSYIVNAFAHCNDCHTHPDRKADGSGVNTPNFLTGGTVFAVPPPLQPVFHQVRTTSANLLGASHGFLHEPGVTFQTFADIIMSGTHADETPPRPLGFPMNQVAANLARLLPSDLHSVYAYVSALPDTTGPSDLPHQDYARWCLADADCGAGETCALATRECVGKACSADLDCDTCQTCAGAVCRAPAPDSACLASAQ